MSKQIQIIIVYFLCFFTAACVKGQSLYPSVLNIETEIDKKEINAKNLSSLLQVNETTSEIALKINIGDIITGNNKLDTMLTNLEAPVALLKGSFPVKNLSFTDNNNEEQKE